MIGNETLDRVRDLESAGKLALEDGDLHRARMLFCEAAELTVDNDRTAIPHQFARRATLLFRGGFYDDAASDCERALDGEPPLAGDIAAAVRSMQADALRRRDSPESITALIRAIIDRDPDALLKSMMIGDPAGDPYVLEYVREDELDIASAFQLALRSLAAEWAGDRDAVETFAEAACKFLAQREERRSDGRPFEGDHRSLPACCRDPVQGGAGAVPPGDGEAVRGPGLPDHP